jgi:hypothetical protein
MAATTRPVAPADLTVLIGLLATLEGHRVVGDIDDLVAGQLYECFGDAGLVPADGDVDALPQALGDLNQRLRYALGEYDVPPVA